MSHAVNPHDLVPHCDTLDIQQVERITAAGAMEKAGVVKTWLFDNGYRITRSGPYQDRSTYPNVDPSRFLIVAERTPVQN